MNVDLLIAELGGAAQLARTINKEFPEHQLTASAIRQWKRKNIMPMDRFIQCVRIIRQTSGVQIDLDKIFS